MILLPGADQSRHPCNDLCARVPTVTEYPCDATCNGGAAAAASAVANRT